MADTPGSEEAATSPKEGTKEQRSRSFHIRIPTARQVGFALFGLMLAAGIAFYIGWCVAFHVCLDNGVYAIVVTLSLFGLSGMWLTLPARPRGA